MKNRKQLLADFYLELLAIDVGYEQLKICVRDNLAYDLQEQPETIQRIFERMADEDAKI